jgi:eukaryotic-like serine/threonine-protein kinase
LALAPGARFGPYEIRAPLGSGGMGEVYRARDTRLDRVVALKTLPPAFTTDSLALERFQREARAIAALNHPNICIIHDVGEADHVRFIVMELLEGETLHERLKRGPLDAPALIDIAIALAGALDAAHKKGMAHRDVKPSNVFLTPHGPKLLDFGLATAPAPSIVHASTQMTVQGLTEEGTTVGTVAYMSPEQLRAEVLDARTDVFSFGSVLYEMATGRPAFPGKTSAVIVSGILERAPASILQSNPKLPAALDHIVSRALEKDRGLRYQSAGDLRSDLERLKRDSTAARGVAAAVSGGDARSRQRTRQAAIVAALAVVIIGAAIVYRFMTSAPAIGSVAVLPFTHESTDPNTESLSNGITESLINSLSEVPKLRVMARNTVFRYKGREVDPRQVGRELQVDGVLTGKVTPQGDMLDIQTELVDVASGSQLWGQHYRRPVSTVLAVQEEIAREISGTLRLNLTGGDQQRLAKRYPQDAEAYRLYLRGRYYFDQRTADGIRRSIETFQEAIRKEPTYALAYAGLANAYISSDTALPPRANVPKAKDAALRALASD